jgi:hypothetical protein
LKPGHSFSEEDGYDMIESCHPRDSKADKEEEAAMAEDDVIGPRKTLTACGFLTECKMQSGVRRSRMTATDFALTAVSAATSTIYGPNPDDPENDGYYPEYCFNK